MFNPLVDNFNDLTDSEIESKISELGRKFFLTHNPTVQQQISVLLDMYKQEAQLRRAKQLQKIQENRNDGLDSLINIS